MQFHRFTLPLAAIALPLVAAPAQAWQLVDESFANNAYNDISATTAEWDTAAGELRLANFTPEIIGDLDLPSQMMDVAVQGDYAYVATITSGLVIVDISDLDAPVQVGAAPIGLGNTHVFVQGDTVYMLSEMDGLMCIDVSDPTLPVQIGAHGPQIGSNDLYVDGTRAYIVDDSGILQILDVADPTTPVVIGSYSDSGTPNSVCASGSTVAINYGNGTRILDISDPTMPTSLGLVATSDPGADVEISGRHAYVAQHFDGVAIIDLDSLSQVGEYDTSSSALDIEVAGDRVYVTNAVDGIVILDVTDPTAPSLVSAVGTPNHSRGIAVAGKHVLVADADGLRVVQTAAPASTTAIGSLLTPGTTRSVHVDGNAAVVVDFHSAVHYVSVLDPENPVILSSYTGLSNVWHAEIRGKIVYAADTVSDLHIFDYSDPANPILASTLGLPGAVQRVTVEGNLAYTGNSSSGMSVVDVSDPSNPVLLDTYNSGYVRGADAEGSLAISCDDDTGFTLLDVSDPSDLVALSSLDTAGVALDADLDGDFAYIADGHAGVIVLNMVNPTSPFVVAAFTTTGSASTIRARGDELFIGDSVVGLLEYDISDPTDPIYVRTYPTAGGVEFFELSGNEAYCIDGNEGLVVFRVQQDEFDTNRNVAQSLTLNASTAEVVSVSLDAMQSDGIAWEVSADGGANWEEIESDGTELALAQPGNDLRWRAILEAVTPGDNPTCDEVLIQWLADNGNPVCGGGSNADCACGEALPTSGCRNSETPGAQLLANGDAEFSADTFSLHVTGLPANRPGLCIKGSSLLGGGNGNPVGDGLLCVLSDLRSQVLVASPQGTLDMADWRGQPFGSFPGTANVGATTYYQVWYRDPSSGCSGSGFNFSNGWAVDWK